MQDDEPKPMTDADASPPPAGAGFEPAAPLKEAGVQFAPENAASAKDGASGVGEAKAGPQKLTQQASDRVLAFAGQGKDRATEALDQLSQMLTDAAQQVDDKLGGQYGQVARDAAGNVQQFAERLRDRPVDDLVEDARVFVRKSPGVAIGAAAAVGFVLARLVSAGVDQHDA